MEKAKRRQVCFRVALIWFAISLLPGLFDYGSTIDRAWEAFAILTPTGPLALIAIAWLFVPFLKAALFAVAAYFVAYMLLYVDQA